MYKSHNLWIALDLIAVANWSARMLIKGEINQEVGIRGDVLGYRSSRISPAPHL